MTITIENYRAIAERAGFLTAERLAASRNMTPQKQ
jgi:hypothetical protein